MLDFIDSEMSGQRIYFKDLACYQEASEEERKKCGREPYFDLSLLPTQQLRKEWGASTLKKVPEFIHWEHHSSIGCITIRSVDFEIAELFV